MQIIDTFSGIGGFSYAGSLLGWRTVQFCEMNEFCNKILSYYWPGVPIHTDIKTLTAKQIINNGLYDKNETTILTGGVPCQPWSLAGKRKGEEDDRNLWPQTIKLIGSLHPDYAVLENVPGFLTWNKGIFLEQMLTSLEAEGYEVFPVVLPACGVNAPHKRERIWFVAYNKSKGWSKRIGQETNSKEREMAEFGQKWNSIRNDIRTSDKTGNRITSDAIIGGKFCLSGEFGKITKINSNIGNNGSQKFTSDPRLLGSPREEQQTTGIEQCDEGTIKNSNGSRNTQPELQQADLSSGSGRCNKQTNRNTESKGLERKDGIRMDESNQSAESDATNSSNEGLQRSQNGREFKSIRKGQKQQPDRSLCTTWEMFPTQSPLCSRDDGLSSRLDGITFPKWRNESIKGYGNAIVPEVALQIFKAIEEFVLNENKV